MRKSLNWDRWGARNDTHNMGTIPWHITWKTLGQFYFTHHFWNCAQIALYENCPVWTESSSYLLSWQSFNYYNVFTERSDLWCCFSIEKKREQNDLVLRSTWIFSHEIPSSWDNSRRFWAEIYCDRVNVFSNTHLW